MKVAPGDVVHVRGTVVGHWTSGPVSVSLGGDTVWVDESDITHVEPPPLKVGEQVFRKKPLDRSIFTIEAISRDMACAWISRGDIHHIVVIDTLERA
jgi:hypothetical protein